MKVSDYFGSYLLALIKKTLMKNLKGFKKFQISPSFTLCP